MSHFFFRPLIAADHTTVERLRALDQGWLTAYSFPALYCWKDFFPLSITTDEDFFLIRCASSYYYPCGSAAGVQRAVDTLINDDAPLEFCYLSERCATELECLYPGRFSIQPRPDSAEYIYETRALAAPTGAHSRNFRRRLRNMERLPLLVREIVSADLPAMREITIDWGLTKREKAGGYAVDIAPTLLALEQFSPLGLRGLVAEFQGRVSAFMLGYENTPDTTTLCMTKHDSSVPPDVLYTLLHAFAGRLTCPYLNLEEDMGNMGLRTMKQQLHPVRLDMSYTARKL